MVWPGQAASVAVGGVRKIPVVHDHAVAPGHVITLTLACDHRILYGAQAVRFLQRIKELLETAEP